MIFTNVLDDEKHERYHEQISQKSPCQTIRLSCVRPFNQPLISADYRQIQKSFSSVP